MGSSDESPFLLHCGVCATQLTDDTALFTSCGHFFCADPNSKCTRIKPENRTFPCEQCGQQCEAGVLSQRGTRYDQRVRSFVFSDLGKEMQTIAEILQVRGRLSEQPFLFHVNMHLNDYLSSLTLIAHIHDPLSPIPNYVVSKQAYSYPERERICPAEKNNRLDRKS